MYCRSHEIYESNYMNAWNKLLGLMWRREPPPPTRPMTPEEIAEMGRKGDLMLRVMWDYLREEITKPREGSTFTPRFPYFHAGINMEIRDQREEDELLAANDLWYEDLVQVKNEHELAEAMGYPCLNERWYHVKIRAAHLRMYKLKSEGRLHPAMSLVDLVSGWVVGSIITDEYFRRLDRN